MSLGALGRYEREKWRCVFEGKGITSILPGLHSQHLKKSCAAQFLWRFKSFKFKVFEEKESNQRLVHFFYRKQESFNVKPKVQWLSYFSTGSHRSSCNTQPFHWSILSGGFAQGRQRWGNGGGKRFPWRSVMLSFPVISSIWSGRNYLKLVSQF